MWLVSNTFNFPIAREYRHWFWISCWSTFPPLFIHSSSRRSNRGVHSHAKTRNAFSSHSGENCTPSGPSWRLPPRNISHRRACKPGALHCRLYRHSVSSQNECLPRTAFSWWSGFPGPWCSSCTLRWWPAVAEPAVVGGKRHSWAELDPNLRSRGRERSTRSNVKSACPVLRLALSPVCWKISGNHYISEYETSILLLRGCRPL